MCQMWHKFRDRRAKTDPYDRETLADGDAKLVRIYEVGWDTNHAQRVGKQLFSFFFSAQRSARMARQIFENTRQRRVPQTIAAF